MITELENTRVFSRKTTFNALCYLTRSVRERHTTYTNMKGNVNRDEGYLTLKQLSKKWGGTSVNTLRGYIRAGKLPNCIRLGKKVLIPLSTILDFEGKSKLFANEPPDEDRLLWHILKPVKTTFKKR